MSAAATRAELRAELLDAARQMPSPFTLTGLIDALTPRWPRNTITRAVERMDAEGLMTMVRRKPERVLVLGRPERGEDPAPDWGQRYPSGGELIGPAWQRQWDAMRDGEWHDCNELVAAAVEASTCSATTARRLLFAAAKERLIEPEARQDDETHRWRIWYRRPALAVL